MKKFFELKEELNISSSNPLKWGKEDFLEAFNFFISLTIAQIRKRQNINEKQKELAYDQKVPEETHLKLDIEEFFLTSAVDYKEFGKKDKTPIENYAKEIFKWVQKEKKERGL